MNRIQAVLAVALIVVPSTLPGSSVLGQEAVLRTSGHGFSFGDPSEVGVRSYRMVSTSLGARFPLRSWLVGGTVVQWARASVSPLGVTHEELSGLTDVTVYTDVAAGPVELRGLVALDVGQTSLTAGEVVVAGLASYEFLPLPLRSWGRGGGLGIDARLPVSAVGLDLEFTGGFRTHGGFSPMEGTNYEYDLGPESRVGFRAGQSMSAFSRIEMGAQFVWPQADQVDGEDVFMAGPRIMAFALGTFPVHRTSVLVRGDLQLRADGEIAAGEISIPRSSGSSLTGGEAASPGRALVVGSVETRTDFGRFSVITETGGRFVRFVENRGTGWLASAGAGSDLEVRGPWPGRLFVTPRGVLHGGRVSVGEGFESSVTSWEVSVGARWEAGR